MRKWKWGCLLAGVAASVGISGSALACFFHENEEKVGKLSAKTACSETRFLMFARQARKNHDLPPVCDVFHGLSDHDFSNLQKAVLRKEGEAPILIRLRQNMTNALDAMGASSKEAQEAYHGLCSPQNVKAFLDRLSSSKVASGLRKIELGLLDASSENQSSVSESKSASDSNSESESVSASASEHGNENEKDGDEDEDDKKVQLPRPVRKDMSKEFLPLRQKFSKELLEGARSDLHLGNDNASITSAQLIERIKDFAISDETARICGFQAATLLAELSGFSQEEQNKVVERFPLYKKVASIAIEGGKIGLTPNAHLGFLLLGYNLTPREYIDLDLFKNVIERSVAIMAQSTVGIPSQAWISAVESALHIVPMTYAERSSLQDIIFKAFISEPEKK